MSCEHHSGPGRERCPECGTELEPGLPRALCPRCALQGALQLPQEKPVAPDPFPSSVRGNRFYDRRWAHAVMSRAAERLREEYAARGKVALFEQIKDIHPGKHGERNYAEVGATLGMSEQAIKNAVHAFRRRYRELVRDEVAQTVSEASLVDDEIRYLMSVFSG